MPKPKAETMAITPAQQARLEKIASRARLDSQVMDYLGNSRICGAGEIAAQLKRSRGAVASACRRLHKRNELRQSRVPREKPLYRFALTGDVVHHGNYLIIAKLSAMIRAVALKAPVLPLQRLKAICLQLRADRTLQSAFAQNYISRCEAALTRLGAVPTRKVLLDKMQWLPFRPTVIRWWPRVLETTYEQPVRRIMKRLDRDKIQRLARDFPKRCLPKLKKLARSRAVKPAQVVKVILEVRQGHEQLLDELKRSGAEEFLRKRDEQLRKLAAPETLPKADLQMVPKSVVNQSLECARDPKLAGSDFGRTQLDAVPEDRVEQAVEKYLAKREAKLRGMRKTGPGWKRRITEVIGLVFDISLALGNLTLAGTAVYKSVTTSASSTEISLALAAVSSVHAAGKGATARLQKMFEEPGGHDAAHPAPQRLAA